MADEPKLVVALEARLDRFEKQLRQAGLIAERQMKEIESKTSSITFGVAAGNLLAKGIEAAVKQTIDTIQKAIEETKELGATAKRTALDFETLQRIGGATAMKGMDSKDFMSGLASAAKAMNDMNHSETQLSQLLDDNNVKYRERNGRVVDVNKGLDLAASLMAKASNALDKEKIAAVFGLTEKWVSVLGEGPEKFAQMKANANVDKELEAGVRATEALFSIVNRISGEFKTWGTAILTYVLGPLQSTASVLAEMSASLAAIHAGTGNFMEGPTKAIAERLGRISKIVDEQIAESKVPRITVSGGGVKGLGGSAAAGGGEKDALTRQEEQLRKINELTKQELATIGMTVAKQEEARQITLLTEAAKRAGLDAETAITAKMREQAAIAGELKQKLAERGAQWNEMLSASKELGSTLSDAMKGMVLQGQKFDEVLKNIGNRIASKAFDKLFDVMFASPSGGGGSMFMNLLGIKALAAGGPASAGRPYLVGEHGPELFVPSKSGLVVPNTGGVVGGRGAASIDMGGFVIDARGASPGVSTEIMQRMRAEMPGIAIAAVAQAQRYGALRAPR